MNVQPMQCVSIDCKAEAYEHGVEVWYGTDSQNACELHDNQARNTHSLLLLLVRLVHLAVGCRIAIARLKRVSIVKPLL